jgi:restriction system protein
VKAYSPNRVVTAEEVWALKGVVDGEGNVSKGVVTTTSKFAPGVYTDERLTRLMPHRLELKNGNQLRQWLIEIVLGRRTQ